MGNITYASGKPEEAEAWYRKAHEGAKKAGDQRGNSRALYNLATLLVDQPERLSEARTAARETLSIQQTLDPSVAQIWHTYRLLASIAEQEGDGEEARTYWRKARATKAAFAGTWYELRQYGRLISAVVETVHDPSLRQELEAELEEGEKAGWDALVATIRQLLDGERDEDTLCASLNLDGAMIVHAILQGIEDPATLNRLQEPEPDNPTQDADPG